MYQTMIPPNTMVQLIGGPQMSGPVAQTQNHALFVNGINAYYPSEHTLCNPDISNYNRLRMLQTGSYPIEMLQFMGLEMPPLHRMNYNGMNQQSGHGPSNGNWQRRSNSSNNNSNGRLSLPAHHNFNRQIGTNSVKKGNWYNKNSKKNSFRGGENSQQKDLKHSNDSGFNSRSPTPGKSQIDGNLTESSDDPDSVMSQSDHEIKRLQDVNRNINLLHSDGIRLGQNGLVPNIPAHQIYHNQRPFYQTTVPISRSPAQNFQNKRRYNSGRSNSPPQRYKRNKKYTGTILPAFNVFPRYMTAPDRFLARSHLVQVTEKPEYLLNGSVWDDLSQSIWDKFIANQQTEKTFRDKMMLWKYLFIYIKSTFPKYGLFLVGSTMNGFGSNNSDVDMCLVVRQTELSQRTEAISHLTLILKWLKRCDFIDHIELIQAKVPILKFHDDKQNLLVDLNCNNPVGIRNTHLLYCYSRIDYRVRPLVLIVKLWAQSQNINDAKNMTISSYSLVLMVIHFLQCGANPSILPCLHLLYKGKFEPTSDIHAIDIHEELDITTNQLPPLNRQSLGELLVQFFKYYSTFDFSKYAISVRLAKKIPIEECRQVRSYKNDPHQWKYLCIEEPFDQTNTARSVYDPEVFEKIKLIIWLSYEKLNATRDLNSIFTKLIPDPPKATT